MISSILKSVVRFTDFMKPVNLMERSAALWSGVRPRLGVTCAGMCCPRGATAARVQAVLGSKAKPSQGRTCSSVAASTMAMPQTPWAGGVRKPTSCAPYPSVIATRATQRRRLGNKVTASSTGMAAKQGRTAGPTGWPRKALRSIGPPPGGPRIGARSGPWRWTATAKNRSTASGRTTGCWGHGLLKDRGRLVRVQVLHL